jgi:hypothetical protein
MTISAFGAGWPHRRLMPCAKRILAEDTMGKRTESTTAAGRSHLFIAAALGISVALAAGADAHPTLRVPKTSSVRVGVMTPGGPRMSGFVALAQHGNSRGEVVVTA